MARILGISKAAVEAAEAAESLQLKVPDDAVEKELRNGDTEKRWTERVVIKNAYVKDDPNNSERTVFFLQLQVQPGSVNKSKLVFANHYVNYPALQADSETDSFMNSRSISALKALIRATNQFLSSDGDIPVDTLTGIFPEKDGGKKSLILGKRVTITIVDRAQKPKDGGDIDLTKRGQNIESYAPDA